MTKRLGLLIVAILMGVMARGGPSALAQMPPNESVTVLQLPAHSPHFSNETSPPPGILRLPVSAAKRLLGIFDGFCGRALGVGWGLYHGW